MEGETIDGEEDGDIIEGELEGVYDRVGLMVAEEEA
jgi:hypothetical protein